MRQMCCLGLTVLLLTGSVSAADDVLDRLPENTKWVLHVDVKKALKSDFGEFVKKQAEREETKRRLAGLKAITGVDLLQDVHVITLCGPDREEQNAALYVQGNYDKERLLPILQLAPGYASITHGNHTIHQWPDQRRGGGAMSYGVFYDSNTIVIAGHEMALKGAIDALDGTADRLDGDELLGDWQDDEEHYFALAALADLDQLPQTPKAQVLKKVDSAYVVLGQKDEDFVAKAAVSAADAEAAQQLSAMLEGIQAAALFFEDVRPAVAAMARDAKVEIDGSRISVELSMPADEVMERVREEARKKRQARANVRGRVGTWRNQAPEQF